jgi:ABC-type polysaccharide/polyol phosphate export permease
MSLGTWASMFGLLVVGCLPMLGLGLVLGYGAKITSAPALASLIYLPMAFGSGIFIPLSQLPTIVKKVAPFLPLYHYGQLGWNLIGAGDESLWQAIAWTPPCHATCESPMSSREVLTACSNAFV